MLAAPIALALAAAFSGAAYYVNEAEQPARLALNDASLLAQWKRSYARAVTMQAGLAALSGAFGLYVAWDLRDWRWLLAALLILTNWPYTLFVIKPINDQLNAIADKDAGAAARALIVKWGRLHAVRTALGILATAVYLWALH
ncbi:MAG TPA: DUF1772 domain-containing protein [Xanthobacteraceae bacterium]|nr:DUF1772 domain-containing protein [Xanthobacteraceae bacterium]